MELYATKIDPLRWRVRPRNTIGASGWINGRPWRVVYVKAMSGREAERKARHQLDQL